MYVLIIIFIISNFVHLGMEIVLGNARVNDPRVSGKINDWIVFEIKKMI